MVDAMAKQHIHITRYQARKAYSSLGIQSVSPGPHTSKPCTANKVYPYLIDKNKITHAHQVLSADITYIRLNKGFIYLVAIIDWHSRFVLNYKVSTTLEIDFCLNALQDILYPELCDIFNVDQGSQFTSEKFTHLLKNHNIQISMDGKGRAIDNIMIERL